MEIKITQPHELSGWIGGKIGKYTFSAKVYDLPSPFGIENGRVSKLGIYEEARRREGWANACIVNYDRGWDIRPKGAEEKEIFKYVLAFLEGLPMLAEHEGRPRK